MSSRFGLIQDFLFWSGTSRNSSSFSKLTNTRPGKYCFHYVSTYCQHCQTWQYERNLMLETCFPSCKLWQSRKQLHLNPQCFRHNINHYCLPPLHPDFIHKLVTKRPLTGTWRSKSSFKISAFKENTVYWPPCLILVACFMNPKTLQFS